MSFFCASGFRVVFFELFFCFILFGFRFLILFKIFLGFVVFFFCGGRVFVCFWNGLKFKVRLFLVLCNVFHG